MGGGYGGGARLECTLRIAGAGDAEMGWEEATEGEFERTLTRRCRNNMGGGYTEGERGRRVR